MKIWFDTEFYEDGKTIELISIGMVRQDGKTYYAETIHAYTLCSKSAWLKNNVLSHLHGISEPRFIKTNDTIARDLVEFAGEKPEFWAYYCSYDWVAVCQLYGTMMDLPKGWPMFCRDVKQLCDSLGNPRLPEQSSTKHNALADALWTREAWEYLQHIASV